VKLEVESRTRNEITTHMQENLEEDLEILTEISAPFVLVRGEVFQLLKAIVRVAQSVSHVCLLISEDALHEIVPVHI
jgi:hypothetical protein